MSPVLVCLAAPSSRTMTCLIFALATAIFMMVFSYTLHISSRAYRKQERFENDKLLTCSHNLVE